MSATYQREDVLWRRREAYLPAGKSIVLSLDPLKHVDLWSSFCDDMGLEDKNVLSSIMCPLPVPEMPMERVRAGARADMLWHPFLWLPPHISSRRSEREVADQDLYALRVAIEVDGTGFYDRGTGTWLDVCSTVGVNLGEPGGLERAQAWLDGAPDTDLDGIDLTDCSSDPSNPMWASDKAGAMFDLLLEVEWSKSAAAQVDKLHELLSGADLQDAKDAAWTVADLSAAWFKRVPAIGSSRLPGRPSDVFEALKERLEKPGTTRDELYGELVPALVDALIVVRDTYRSSVEILIASEEEDEDDAVVGPL